jgi:hypothetical protein
MLVPNAIRSVAASSTASCVALQVGGRRAGERKRQEHPDRPQRTAGRLDDSRGPHGTRR